MNNQEYWEKRKARELYSELKKAEDTAEELRKVYLIASDEISKEAIRILQRFQLKHHLTEAEAEKLIRQLKNPEDIRRLIQALKTNPQNSELAAELESQAYGARIARLSGMQAAVDTVAVELFKRALPKTQSVLNEIGRAMYYRELFGIQKRANAAFPVNPLDSNKIAKVLNTRWSGKNFSTRLWGNTERLAGAVKEQILLELITGKRQYDIAKDIGSRFSNGFNEVRRLVRTESCYVANQLQAEAYKEAGVERYIYVAVLDLRTSKVCRGLDKKVFKVSEAQAGKNLPPMHPWCRSTTIAWMPEALLKNLKQRAWDPVNGEYVTVPGDMTYQEWFDKYVKDSEKTPQKGTQSPTEGSVKGRNLTQEQYAKYKKRLGDDFAYTYDEFVKLKANKDEWEKFKKKYKDAKRPASFTDITDEWKAATPWEKGDVVQSDEVVGSDGKTYKIVPGSKDVEYDHDANEENAADIVSREKNATVELLPKVNQPKGVRTPDCNVDEDPYEIKSSVRGTSENTLLNCAKKAKGQSDRLILNLQRCKLSDEEVQRQIPKMLKSKRIDFLNEIVIVWKDTVYGVFGR